jgi:hypothetical protein
MAWGGGRLERSRTLSRVAGAVTRRRRLPPQLGNLIRVGNTGRRLGEADVASYSICQNSSPSILWSGTARGAQ